MEPVSLAARQVADALLLVAAAEVERGGVGAGRTSRFPSVIVSLPPEISFHTVVAGIEIGPRLVDVGELDRRPDVQLAAVGLSSPAIMRKSVVLPAPFAPMTPTMPPGGSENDSSRRAACRHSPC